MKPIRSPEDHRALLEEMAGLMGAGPGSPEADRLEVLAVIAADYERRRLPPESDPVDLLNIAMRGRGLAQSDLSEVLGSRARASEILSRRRSLSADMIDRLSRAWAIPKRLLAAPAAAEPKRRRTGTTAFSVAAGALALLATASASPFLLYGHDLPDVAPLLANASSAASPAVLPPHVVQAFIAAEDRRFLSHGGYDPEAIARATGRTLAAGLDHPQGGATLTQQLLKATLLAGEPRSVRRKVREILLARRLEGALTKDQILGLYLAKVYFGGGTYGIDAAAHRYFGRSPTELSVGQAAYLAGLLDAPDDRRFDRPENRLRSLAARGMVLARMERAGFVTPATVRDAERERLW